MSKYELQPTKEVGKKCAACDKPAKLEEYQGANFYNYYCSEDCRNDYDTG
jgi:hypothetical protein